MGKCWARNIFSCNWRLACFNPKQYIISKLDKSECFTYGNNTCGQLAS